ncbi:cytochrome c family protein [bacterium]|nr:cytochrome c family protein [bacterium]
MTPAIRAQKKGPHSTFRYGGVATCKPCHFVKRSGAQFKIWQAGPHARAYETLKTEKALQWAKERGIDDPQKSEKCVKCHVTAYAVVDSLKGPKLKLEEGVSCEACHGPGSEYKKLKLMRDIYAGTVQGSQHGLVEPNEELCITCHNEESPAFAGFNYEEMVAKISHPVPK